MNRVVIALGYAFCWGVGVTLTKVALSEIQPTTLLTVQLGSSVLFLSTISYLKNRDFLFSQQRLRQGAAGIFEPALAYMVGIFGIQLTTASNATLIGSSEVILTILFAAVFLRERLTGMKVLLSGVSFVGVLLLMLEDAEGAGQASLFGNLLVLLGTGFAVCYVLFSKKQIQNAEPLQLTSSQQLVGFLTTVVCFGALAMADQNYAISVTGISLPYWLLAVGSGIMQYALAFLLYLIALQHIPVSHAAFYVALIPVFGVASAVVILGEHPSLAQLLGGALVVLSSYFAGKLKN